MAAQESESGDRVPMSRGDMLTTGLMMAAALAAITGFGVIFSLWWRTGVSDDYEVLRIASQEFVSGRPIVAGELAETVEFEEDSDILDELTAEEAAEAAEEQVEVASEDDGPEVIAARKARAEREEWIRLRDFLVGVGKVARSAEEDDLRERRRHLYEAVPYLETAQKNGFPPGRQTEGHRILGETLYKLGRYDDAIDALSVALERDPTLRRELLPMLAEAQLNSLAPLGEQVLATINQYLNDKGLRQQQLRPGQLIQIRALIDLKRWGDAERSINRAGQFQTTSDELSVQTADAEFRNNLALLQSVVEIKRAMDRYGVRPVDEYEDRTPAVKELAATIKNLADLQREATPRIAAMARLWAARALIVQGIYDEALIQLTAVRQQRPFGAEAIVGGLEEIELLSRQGTGVEFLQTTRYVMRELGDVRGFDASLISFDEFRRRMGEAIDQLRRRGDFQHAIDAARSLPPVFEISEALIHEAIGYSEWAAATISDGTDISGQVARSASTLARSYFRAAGDAFAEAARRQFDTEDYLDTQWSAIDAYQRGRHFTQSIRLLEQYLRYEERRRQPRGLVAVGRALLAVGEPVKAIEALNTCIAEFPRDPLRPDARLLAALAYAEQGDLENARILLNDNLQDGDLAPSNPAWQNSLLTLGELMYERGYRNFLLAEQAKKEIDKYQLLRENQPILEEAIRYLDEAVERYFPMPRAETAAYLAARAHVMSSRWPRIESRSPEILDAARRTLRTQADQELQTALDGFTELRKHLANREEEQRLPDAEQSMLRNCFLAEADVLREMDQLEDAANAYRTVELRYMNEPPALEAILGRAGCAKGLGRPREADLLIRQANVVLQRIPRDWDERFEETTRYDRDGWQAYLTWMNQRISNGA